MKICLRVVYNEQLPWGVHNLLEQPVGRGCKFRKIVHVIRVNLCSHEGGGGQKMRGGGGKSPK